MNLYGASHTLEMGPAFITSGHKLFLFVALPITRPLTCVLCTYVDLYLLYDDTQRVLCVGILAVCQTEVIRFVYYMRPSLDYKV